MWNLWTDMFLLSLMLRTISRYKRSSRTTSNRLKLPRRHIADTETTHNSHSRNSHRSKLARSQTATHIVPTQSSTITVVRGNVSIPAECDNSTNKIKSTLMRRVKSPLIRRGQITTHTTLHQMSQFISQLKNQQCINNK